MKRSLGFAIVLLALAAPAAAMTKRAVPVRLRPLAVPLVTCDPYFSVCSANDQLTHDDTKHRPGTRQALHSMLRVDGEPYRLMGRDPRDFRALAQGSVQVLPTRTIYDFEGAGVHVTLTFMTPMLPHDLDLMSWPVTYLTWDVRVVDGKQHDVSLYYGNSGELVVNTPDQAVTWAQEDIGGFAAVRMRSQEQPILAKKGDDLRIDWGYLYAATPNGTGVRRTVGLGRSVLWTFARAGSLPEAEKLVAPRAVRDGWPVTAMALDLGKVGPKGVSRYIILAYDDIYSIEYLGTRLRPY
jgi:hypothetical protein